MSKNPINGRIEVISTDPSFDLASAAVRYSKWFPDLSRSQVNALLVLQSEMLAENKVGSLFSSSVLKNFESTQFGDSILGSRMIAKELIAGEPLYDVGGASGLPGLIFGVLFPDVKVVVVGKEARRLEFWKRAVGTAGLKNVSVLSKSVEDLPAGSLVNLVERGSGVLHKVMLGCRKQTRKGGRFFHIKGDGWANELTQVPSQLFSYWAPKLVGQYKLPESSTENSVVLTEKISD